MRGRCPHFLVVRDLSEVPFFCVFEPSYRALRDTSGKVPSYRALRDTSGMGREVCEHLTIVQMRHLIIV